MSNVAFGGNWSEELVAVQELRDVFLNFEWAVENCTERDVNSEAMREALDYVRNHVEKGPMLVERWERGYKIENQNLRKKHFEEAFGLIYAHAGF